MSDGPLYFEVLEQTRFLITVKAIKNIEDVGDSFIFAAELEELLGNPIRNYYFSVDGTPTTRFLEGGIRAALEAAGEKLEASPHQSIELDPELVAALKHHSNASPVKEYTDGQYMRRGSKLLHHVSRTRKKTKPTQGDVNLLWHAFYHVFAKKHGVYPPWAYKRYYSTKLFRAMVKKLIPWKDMREHLLKGYRKDNLKFFKMVWDNPEDYM